jgi:anti-sigma B factor antagonist
VRLGAPGQDSSCGRTRTRCASQRCDTGYLAGRTLLHCPLPERILIAPQGVVDIARIAEFRAALSDAARADGACLVVDLSQVSFIDSSGLGALVELHHRLRRGRRQLAVVAPGGTAAAVLIDLSGLRGRLKIFETRRAALET